MEGAAARAAPWLPLVLAAAGPGCRWSWRPLVLAAAGPGGRWSWRPLVLAAAPGQQRHNDEDDDRDQPDDDDRLEHCEDPADGREADPYGEDHAENCQYHPAHALRICTPGAPGGRSCRPEEPERGRP